MSVNDKWHYCHNSEVLVGSRAMRDRHLRLLGYIILQVWPLIGTGGLHTAHLDHILHVGHMMLSSVVPSQLPYHELEKLNGIEEVKQYLHKKLLDVPL